MKKRKTFAVIRAAAAVIAAFALLAGTGFGIFPMLRGPETVTDGTELESGRYVRADLTYVMDICGVEKDSGGEAVAYYAVAPVGNKFAVVRFPASEYANALAMENETTAFLRGDNTSMSIHLVVTGTTKTTDGETAALFKQWFEDNAQWMSSSGVIAAVEDYSVYLGDVTIQSGRIRNVSFTVCIVLSALALLLLLYAVFEFILAGLGVYDREPEKRKKKEKKAPAAPTAAETEASEAPAEESAAAPPETEMEAGAGEDAAGEDEETETAAAGEAEESAPAEDGEGEDG